MKYFILLFILFFSAPAFAEVKLSDVHAMETSTGIKNGVLLMTMENLGDRPDRLIGVKTPVATAAEIHQMSMTNGIMKMRETGAVPLEPNKKITLDSNGYHIMLMGLKQPLAAGKSFPVTLTFERSGEILTSVRVKSHMSDQMEKDGAMPDMSGHMNMGH